MTYSLDCTYCWYKGAEQSPCQTCSNFTGDSEDKCYLWKEGTNAQEKVKISIAGKRTRKVGRATKG